MLRREFLGLGSAVLAYPLAVQAQLAPSTPAPSPNANSPTPFANLPGRWVRRDGGYTITIRAVEPNGKVDASYSNPSMLPFYASAVTSEGGALKLFFELRAGGYNGSTYTLIFDAAGDQLRGVYYQAVARQTFDVIFERAK